LSKYVEGKEELFIVILEAVGGIQWELNLILKDYSIKSSVRYLTNNWFC
jgi:hypothetical protein